MDLRDRFAVELAAALLNGRSDPEELARHAYDLADAMLRERERRMDEESREMSDASSPDAPFDDTLPIDSASYGSRASLLDDPEPLEPEAESGRDEDLPDWLDAPYDPRWELETRWNDAGIGDTERPSSKPAGPGLVRTQGEPARSPDSGDPRRRLG